MVNIREAERCYLLYIRLCNHQHRQVECSSTHTPCGHGAGSRYVMLAKLENKKTETVVTALIKQAHKLPGELYKSLTWDRGTEMSGHQRFTLETDIQVYFCDPRSPWQRGSNENTNQLLRDYLPKGTDLSVYSQRKLNWIAKELNERPRKTLEFEIPAARFNQCVASTG
jgi:IS30 family transposase